jgi:hypothetical protein
MTNDSLAVISLGLMGMLIFQQVYLTMTINRLVNKVMSKSYGEYELVKDGTHKETVLRVQTDTEPMQDLNEIMGLGPQL